MKTKKIIVANWKMNPLNTKDAIKLFSSIKSTSQKNKKTSVVVCSPSIFLPVLSKYSSIKCALGAQNMHFETNGAFTGEISAKMLKDSKVSYVILGHSERRAMGEDDIFINQKIKMAIKSGITPILCVGEKERTGDAWYLHAVKTQVDGCLEGLRPSDLAKIVIAYEPVWAIGKDSVRVATPSECEEMVIYIRKVLSDKFGAKNAQTPMIVYGGSVDSKEAQDFMMNGGIDGFLVGRASLNPKEFEKIVQIVDLI